MSKNKQTNQNTNTEESTKKDIPSRLTKLDQLAVCRAQSDMMYRAIMDTMLSRRLSKKATYHKTPLKNQGLHLVNPETGLVSIPTMKYVGEAMLEIFRMSQTACALMKV